MARRLLGNCVCRDRSVRRRRSISCPCGQLAEELTLALLKAEGVEEPGPTRGVLQRAGQKQLVAEITRIVAKISGDPTQAGRTWVLLTEAVEGGWGLAGTAFGKEEFAALAARAGARP
jgi:phenylpyruvate tautomerase PptA (4-oxalocrotonate tautomerase family)